MTDSKTVVSVTPFSTRVRKSIFYKTISRETVTPWRVARVVSTTKIATIERISLVKESVDEEVNGLFQLAA